MNVFITGAAGGLGRAFAVECAKRGYDMFLTDLNEEGLHAIRQGILCRFDVEVHAYPCDITSDTAVDEMMEYARRNDLRFDMLLNVAGVDFEGGFTQRTSKHILDIVRINIEATLRVTYAVLGARRENGKLYIGFVSSLAAMYPMPLKATYAASKRFLLDFSIALGQELKKENVRVLSLCPGGLPTTEEAMRGISAQGFWGGATTNRLEAVAHNTISRLIQGQKIYVPGLVNSTLCTIGKLIPARLAAKIVYGRWAKIHA